MKQVSKPKGRSYTMKKRMLFMDLDGTLLNDAKQITQGNRDALNQALERGHGVIITTGRPLKSALAQAKRLGLDKPGCYTIAYNILGNPMDAEECTNDTYLALWNAIPPVSPDPLAPYVYRTGRNTALKRLHRDTAKKTRRIIITQQKSR